MGRNIQAIISLKDKFTPNIKKIADATGKTEKEIKKARMEIIKFQNSASKVAQKAVVGFGAVAAASAVGVFALAKKTAETADTIDEMSQQIGISRKGYQEWKYILEQNGMEIDGLKRGFKSLTENVYKAKGGNKEVTATFKRLGISVKDSSGHLKSQEQLFEDSVKALQGMKDGTEKAHLANQLFGKSAIDLRPILNANSEYITKMKSEAEKYGVVLDDKTVDAGAKFADTLKSLEGIISAVGFSLGADMLPALQKVADTIKTNMPQIRAVATTIFNNLGHSIKFVADNLNWLIPVATAVVSTIMTFRAIEGVISMINTLKTVISAVTVVQGIWNTVMLANPIGLIAVGIGALIGVVALLIANWDRLKKAAIGAVNAMKRAFHIKPKAASVVTNSIPQHATGTSFAPGGVSLVGEEGPELRNIRRGDKITNSKQSRKLFGNNIEVNLTVLGNMIGNEEYAHYISNVIYSKLSNRLATA